MLLSICVPSYNRGKRALNLALELEELWKKYPDDIEIVVSNNGSVKETEEYMAVSQMASDHFTYFEFDENRQYVGNYNQVIRLAQGDWCLIISDEDHIIADNFDLYMNYMRANPQLSLIRGNTDSNYLYSDEECGVKSAGADAIKSYFLKGNYISGIIYNRKYLTNEVIDRLEQNYSFDDRNEGYFSYPHMFVEALLMLSGDIFICKDMLIHEDESAGDAVKDNSMDIPFYASFEERIEQAKGYLDYINRLECANSQKASMLMIIISKTFAMVHIVKMMYIYNGYNWEDIIETVYEELLGYILSLDMNVFRLARKDFLDYLEDEKNWYLKN